MSRDDFDWSIKNEDVVLPEQRATAVHYNQWGQIIIRQEGDFDDEHDPWLIVSHSNVPKLIEALQTLYDNPVQRQRPEEAEIEK
jgi:hypothetical protein